MTTTNEPNDVNIGDEAVNAAEAAALDRVLEEIARRALRIPTLAQRGSDGLDFHTVAVWSVRESLRLAYQAGREADRNCANSGRNALAGPQTTA